MKSVFNNPYTQAPQVWSAQGAAVTWGQTQAAAQANQAAANKVFAALGGITINYQRPVSMRYPIGGSAPIQLIGAPSGVVQLNTIIGPSTELNDFLDALASACKPITIIVTNSSIASGQDCDVKSQPQEIVCNGAIGSQVQYNLTIAQGGMAIAQGTFVLQFTEMKWSSTNS